MARMVGLALSGVRCGAAARRARPSDLVVFPEQHAKAVALGPDAPYGNSHRLRDLLVRDLALPGRDLRGHLTSGAFMTLSG